MVELGGKSLMFTSKLGFAILQHTRVRVRYSALNRSQVLLLAVATPSHLGSLHGRIVSGYPSACSPAPQRGPEGRDETGRVSDWTGRAELEPWNLLEPPAQKGVTTDRCG